MPSFSEVVDAVINFQSMSSRSSLRSCSDVLRRGVARDIAEVRSEILDGEPEYSSVDELIDFEIGQNSDGESIHLLTAGTHDEAN